MLKIRFYLDRIIVFSILLNKVKNILPIGLCERKQIIMKKQTKPQKTNFFKKVREERPLMWLLIETIMPTLLGVVVLVCSNIGDIFAVPGKIEELNSSFEELSEDVEKINGELADLQVLSERISSVDQRCSDLFNMIAPKVVYPTEIFKDSLGVNVQEYEIPLYLAEPKWEETDVLAKDSDGNEYTARDLVDKKLLVPYIENGEEVYFYGQYNSSNQWEGNCIINVYKDDILVLVTDATYAAGVVIDYKQVLPSVTQSGEKIWIISERVNEGDYNSGKSWNYVRESDKTKDFEIDTVEEKDILAADTFPVNSRLEGFYYGNTAGGLYNDETGNAYMVKYDEDGYVRTLYSGRFKDGKFDDNTGNAWYITRNEKTDYMYYKGKFSDGSPENDKASQFYSNLTLNDIENFIKGKDFEVELRWAITNSMEEKD